MVRELLRVLVECDLHRGLGLCHRDSRLQASDGAKVVLCLLSGGRFEAEREPGVGRIVEEPEALRHDAKDLGRLSIDLYGLADYVRTAGKASLPHRVAEHYGGRGAGLLVGSDGEPAQQGSGAERREARRRNPVPVQSFRGAAGVAREVGRSPRVEGADGFEGRAGPVAQKEVQPRRHHSLRFRLAGRRHAHVQEPVGLRVRHGLEQHGAREAEDQDVEAHSQGQRHQGDGREPRRVSKTPHGQSKLMCHRRVRVLIRRKYAW